MTRVRSKDTDLEVAVRSRLHRRGLRFKKHVATLPGKPDVVFPVAKVAVFVNGDFWHGRHFARWRDRMRTFWQEKIEKNRARDARNFRSLRRAGWLVIRIWQREIHDDVESCVDGIVAAVQSRRQDGKPTGSSLSQAE
jgi:DNA mismatch endonuclease, patch repair protein